MSAPQEPRSPMSNDVTASEIEATQRIVRELIETIILHEDSGYVMMAAASIFAANMVIACSADRVNTYKNAAYLAGEIFRLVQEHFNEGETVQ